MGNFVALSIFATSVTADWNFISGKKEVHPSLILIGRLTRLLAEHIWYEFGSSLLASDT